MKQGVHWSAWVFSRLASMMLWWGVQIYLRSPQRYDKIVDNVYALLPKAISGKEQNRSRIESVTVLIQNLGLILSPIWQAIERIRDSLQHQQYLKRQNRRSQKRSQEYQQKIGQTLLSRLEERVVNITHSLQRNSIEIIDIRLPRLENLPLYPVSLEKFDILGRFQALARIDNGWIVFNEKAFLDFQDKLEKIEYLGTPEELIYLESVIWGTIAEQILKAHWLEASQSMAEDELYRLQQEINRQVNASFKDAQLWQIWPLSQKLNLGIVTAMAQEGGLAEYVKEIVLGGYASMYEVGEISLNVFGHREDTPEKMSRLVRLLREDGDNPLMSMKIAIEIEGKIEGKIEGNLTETVTAKIGRLTLRHPITQREKIANKMVIDLSNLLKFGAVVDLVETLKAIRQQTKDLLETGMYPHLLTVLQVDREWIGNAIVPPPHVEAAIALAKEHQWNLYILVGEEVYYSSDIWGGAYVDGEGKTVKITSIVEDRSVKFTRKELDKQGLSKGKLWLKVGQTYRADYRIYRVTRFNESKSLPKLIQALQEAKIDAINAQLLLTSYMDGKRITGILGGFVIRSIAQILNVPIFPTMHHTVNTTDLAEAGKATNLIDWLKITIGSEAIEVSYQHKKIYPVLLLKYYRDVYQKYYGIKTEQNIHGFFDLLGGDDRQKRKLEPNDFQVNKTHWIGSVGKWETRKVIESAKSNFIVRAIDLPLNILSLGLWSEKLKPKPKQIVRLEGYKQQLIHIRTAQKTAYLAKQIKQTDPDKYSNFAVFGLIAGGDNPNAVGFTKQLLADLGRQKDGLYGTAYLRSTIAPEEVLVISQEDVNEEITRSQNNGLTWNLERYQDWLKHRIIQESKRRTVELNKTVEINTIYRPHRIDGDEFDWLNRKFYSVTLLLYHATMGTSGVAHQVIGYGIPVVVPNLTEFRYLQKFMSAKINGKPVSGLELVKTRGKGIKRSPDENDAAAKTLDLILDRERRLQMAQANLLIANRYQADIVSAGYDNMVRQKMGLNELAISWWDGKIPDLNQKEAENSACQRDSLYQWRAKASLAMQAAECTELMPELLNLKLTKWQLQDLKERVRLKDWQGLVVMLRKQLASKDYSEAELEKLIESLILDNKQINLFLDDNLAVELSESLVVAVRK